MARIVRVDVDTQNGFCDPKGGLFVKGGADVTPRVALLNHEAEAKGYTLIGCVDTHITKDKEFKEQGGLWPAHCILGTWDWLKVEETLPENYRFIDEYYRMDDRQVEILIRETLDKGTALYFEKSIYSILDNSIAQQVIHQLADQDSVFEVYGLAIDYCVKAAALGIKQAYPKATVRLLKFACAGVTPETTSAALAEMKAAGIEIIE